MLYRWHLGGLGDPDDVSFFVWGGAALLCRLTQLVNLDLTRYLAGGVPLGGLRKGMPDSAQQRLSCGGTLISILNEGP